jgi:hypothetical protein
MTELPAPRIIPFPKEGLLGVQSLIELGEDRLKRLAEVMAVQPLDLSFEQLCSHVAEDLGCDPRTLQAAFVHALVPLHGLRRNLALSPSEFLISLAHTVSEKAPDDWKQAYEKRWEAIVGRLGPLLEADNFFSQASKAFDLLSERPAVLQGARILTELRPIFDEAATKTLAYLLTNTLVVDYWDGETVRPLHLTLDTNDLEKLEAEVKRAKAKIAIVCRESAEAGTNVVIYGNTEG